MIASINNQAPLVSIITIVFNNANLIRNAIESVLSQDYQHIEYILIDGGSNDGTKEIINSYKDEISVLISEPDKGIYDALNKGIEHSSGEYIAILHSDDLFCNSSVVSNMMNEISKNNAEICFSDMVIVDQDTGEILRYYMASYFKKWMFKVGWMPPHPTCFIKKSLFYEFGVYSLDYKVAADFDFLVRVFFNREINWAYLNQITVKMRDGGISNSGIKGKKLISSEIKRSLKSNHIKTLFILQLVRYLIRLVEIFKKPRVESD